MCWMNFDLSINLDILASATVLKESVYLSLVVACIHLSCIFFKSEVTLGVTHNCTKLCWC